MQKRRLLFITQKINQEDDDLAFTILWVQGFIKAGFLVEVICLEKEVFDDSFPVHSLGKEKKYSWFRRILRFYRFLFLLKYDRVFVHMNPEYFTLGGWWWWLTNKPSYFWYTHYTMSVHVWLAGHFAKRLFAATPQSLPQFDGNPKKTILGHGIDTAFWLSSEHTVEKSSETELLTVHRVSRSKRVELIIKSLSFLPAEYRLSIYGRAIDPTYKQELDALVQALGLESRVFFMGPLPMPQLKLVYPKYRLMVNMASETIDKTMLEGMLFGIYPVTTAGNARAIGISLAPMNDTPEAVAAFIKEGKWRQYGPDALRKIVRTKHSLPSLIDRMGQYISEGI